MIVKGLPPALFWLAIHIGCLSTSQAVGFGLVVWPKRGWPPRIWPPRSTLVEFEDGITDVLASTDWGMVGFAALKVGGEVVTWGDRDIVAQSSAVEAKLRSDVSAIFSNAYAFAALKAGGEVVTWGMPKFGADSSAVEAQLRGNVTAIFSGRSAFAALRAGGEVVTWGQGPQGGDSSAVEAQLRGNVTAISSGRFALAALKACGEVVTWGDPYIVAKSSAVEAKLRSDVTAIFSNAYAFAALKAGGEVVTWGSGPAGAPSSAVEAQLRGNVTTMFSNANVFAALKAGGEVVTWGDPNFGADSSAVKAKLRGNVTAISSGTYAFAALKAGGEVVTWGSPFQGGSSWAVEAKLRGNVTAVVNNERAFAALKVGGEVVTWGSSGDGGNSATVEAKLRSDVIAISSNGNAFAALKAGGEVVTWGDPQFGGDSSGLSLHARVTMLKSFPTGFGALICIPRRQSRKNWTPHCELCKPNESWSGVTDQCQRCERHFEVPSDDQSSCEPCRAGFIPDSNQAACVECSGNAVADAAKSMCQPCRVGMVPNSIKSACEYCDDDEIVENGICRSCPRLFHPNDLQVACLFDYGGMLMRISYIILISMFVKLLFVIFSRRFVVIDVSLKNGKAILTTLTDHHLSCPPYRPTFPIQLQGTCHPCLDASDNVKPKVARAKVEGRKSLELLDIKGNSLNERFDTSRGTLLLTYADTCLHVSLLRIPLVLPAGLIFCAILLLAIDNLEAAESGILSSAAVLASIIFWSFMKKRESYRKTPLEMELDKFRKWLSTVNPKPTSCPKGPGRAITLEKVLQTHNSFRTFIQDRTAYYLNGSILMPLTAPYRLSYAELVGPDMVDFFVSHFWGTEFTHFCSSLQKHAEMVDMPRASGKISSVVGQKITFKGVPIAQNQQVAYWICFCSNNQYDIHNELGGDIGCRESSFYLALQSPSCQSSCMVIDDKALPLRRSWCIFETLQALQLSQKRSGFELLMCTASGVLNFGNASIEAAIGVVIAVSCMDLQDAQASNKADKVMIDRLVLEEMGSFEKLNNFIREQIYIILGRAQETCSSEFQNLFEILEASRQMETPALASTSQRCSSSSSSSINIHSNEDERRSELNTLYGRSVELSRKKREIEEQEEQLKMKLVNMGISIL